MQKSVAFAVSGLMGATIGLLALALAAGLPLLLGYNAHTILSSSMAPAIPVGSVVVSKPVSPEALAPGDIVTFRHPGLPALPITHRIVGVNLEDSKPAFITKGDANPDVDLEPLRVEGRADVVAYTIPFAGYLVNFGASRFGVLLFILVPCVGLALVELASWRGRRTTTPSGTAPVS
jgi:signal peptidase